MTANIPSRGSDAKYLFDIEEARGALGHIGRTLLYQLVRERKLRITKIRGRSFITRTDLERFIRALKRPA